MRARYRRRGFTLIEMIIVVAAIGILSAIALPAYTHHVVKSRRAAAEACLSNFANAMEVYYATNLRYDQNTAGTAIGALTTAFPLECSNSSNTGNYYLYTFATGFPTQTQYTLQAKPQNSQAKDTQCGTLTLDQGGSRKPTTSGCWAQ